MQERKSRAVLMMNKKLSTVPQQQQQQKGEREKEFFSPTTTTTAKKSKKIVLAFRGRLARIRRRQQTRVLQFSLLRLSAPRSRSRASPKCRHENPHFTFFVNHRSF